MHKNGQKRLFSIPSDGHRGSVEHFDFAAVAAPIMFDEVQIDQKLLVDAKKRAALEHRFHLFQGPRNQKRFFFFNMDARVIAVRFAKNDLLGIDENEAVEARQSDRPKV